MDGLADEMRQAVADVQLCLQELLDRERGPSGAASDQGPTDQPKELKEAKAAFKDRVGVMEELHRAQVVDDDRSQIGYARM